MNELVSPAGDPAIRQLFKADGGVKYPFARSERLRGT
jgi:hypothetical protein